MEGLATEDTESTEEEKAKPGRREFLGSDMGTYPFAKLARNGAPSSS